MTVVSVRDDRLDVIVGEIIGHHREVHDSLGDAVHHAIVAGHLLAEARGLVPLGAWCDWLGENLDGVSLGQAYVYMRMARNEELVRTSDPRTMREALGLTSSRKGRPRYDESFGDTVRDLRSEGMTMQAIADMTGASISTVKCWLNPEVVARYRRNQARASRAGRRAALREERSSLARSVGGDVGEAYSLVRRALQHLDTAQSANTGEIRRLLRSSMTDLYAAEDLVAKAMKVMV